MNKDHLSDKAIDWPASHFPVVMSYWWTQLSLKQIHILIQSVWYALAHLMQKPITINNYKTYQMHSFHFKLVMFYNLL